MSPAASLDDLVGYLEESPALADFRVYFDQQTARIVTVEESTMKAVEDGDNEALAQVTDEDKEDIEIAREVVHDKTGRFIKPPDNSLFDESRLKAQFIKTIHDANIARKLADAGDSKGLRRLFSNSTFASVLYRYGLEEQWYEYRANAVKQFVIDWVKANHLDYEDDLKKAEK